MPKKGSKSKKMEGSSKALDEEEKKDVSNFY